MSDQSTGNPWPILLGAVVVLLMIPLLLWFEDPSARHNHGLPPASATTQGASATPGGK